MTDATKSLSPPPPPPPPAQPATTLENQEHPTTTPPSSIQSELNAAVDDLLDQLQHKFDGVSRDIFAKLDDMARRLDELEASLALMDGPTASPEGTGTGTGAGAGSVSAGSGGAGDQGARSPSPGM
ncbi:heat shock factor-binding 1 family protein [Aspergillus homomorphus CBS 101889]|uniref:Heat shock factor binding protein 1-domain-containing protein n=1 Tax=Aspergillus homomorphus (strain CBS 101889) TaxID=1450537 RepID=A0A395I2M6_ASPHC|nr:hypothetical protein BO97DRAFT_422870 [Aspergillus homomorphus CBS 101889]RAL13956.1 hypothetical protein BO97DRAFT_422870 [Aspergillus homomorphus CBS 101889]